jgi:hypothetical protein
MPNSEGMERTPRSEPQVLIAGTCFGGFFALVLVNQLLNAL